jgi:DDRGK domain-containing protein 1
LEELGDKFMLKTQDCIDRIVKLEKEGVLTGIMDDRGKFIYITNDEMDSVVDYINKKGRLTISELSEESNKLIKIQE